MTVLIAALMTASCAGNNPADAPEPSLTIVAPLLDSPIEDRMPPEDERPFDPVKLAVFNRINRDRTAEGIPAVLWDDAASRVADEYCKNQIRERTSGHFLTNGVPPYARTSFAGVFGRQYENSVTWRTTAPAFEESVTELALESHAGMLAERPPNDGHRRTILDPAATHVGVGYAIVGGNFRMAQEFLTRQLAWVRLEGSRERPVIDVHGAPVAGRRLQFVTVGWEPAPEPLTREEASGRTSYSYPPPILGFVEEGNVTLKVAGTVTDDRIRLTGRQAFSFRFTPDRPGLWTFEFYTIAAREARPTQGGAISVWFDRPSRAP
ncbi:MAG TPA: CAP domain-containing protein [Thermoanaerobaculia bacterium]|nr:CAP domain-containing protein [Thermoanaerobaculia bacterium]